MPKLHSYSSRWSFGGNRLQVKAETRLLADVHSALQHVAHIGAKTMTSLTSLQPKQDLLSMLLTNEQGRLTVWLYSLNYERRHHLTSGHHERPPTDVSYCSAQRLHTNSTRLFCPLQSRQHGVRAPRWWCTLCIDFTRRPWPMRFAGCC